MGVTNFDIVQCNKFKISTTGDVVAQGTTKNHITSAKVNYTTGDLDTESKQAAALNTTNTSINSILSALEEFGILKDS